MNSWHRADWFAFFQAIGSVVAIFAAGGIAAYQGFAARKLASEQKRQRDAVIVTALRALIIHTSKGFEALAKTLDDLPADRIPGFIYSMRNHQLIDKLSSNLDNLPLHELPQARMVEIVAEIRADVQVLHATLGEYVSSHARGEHTNLAEVLVAQAREYRNELEAMANELLADGEN